MDADFTADDLAALLKAVPIQRQTRSTTAHLVRQDGYDTTDRLRRLVLGATLLLCLLPAIASAQPVMDPSQLEFSPSLDHATATGYTLDVAIAGQLPVVKSVDLGKPAPQTDGKIRASLVSLLLPGLSVGVTYEARVSAYGPAGKSTVAVSPDTFQFACPVTLSASAYAFEPFGGSGSVTITTPAVCPWAATSSVPWLTAKSSTASGFGTGTAVITAAINDTKAQRSAVFTVGGQPVAVTQDVAACSYLMKPVSLPASVANVIDPATTAVFAWADLDKDPRALQAVSYPGRRAAAWYAATTVSIKVPAVTAGPQQLAVYVVDFDASGRAETIDILDAKGAVLDSRSVASYGSGQYLVWTVAGDVTIRATRTAGPNALISGVFVGPTTASVPAGTAAFVKTDTATAGDWMAGYGGNAYSIAGDLSSRLYTSAGGFGALAMVAPSICPWSVTSSASWLTVVSSATGTGEATVALSMAANPTGAFRMAVISSQGQNVEFVQAGMVTKPDSVDCVVSAWSDWGEWSAWTALNATTEQRTHTRTRTVTTPASNGGAACPALTETVSETRAITTTNTCDGAVVLAVGDWTRGPSNPGDSGRVLLSIGKSKQPVTEVWTFVDDKPVPSLPANPNPKTGDDLRGIAGVYFLVPAGSGSHKVSVSAKTADGCEDGGARPMTLVVK